MKDLRNSAKISKSVGLTSKSMNVNSLKQTMEGAVATEPHDIRKETHPGQGTHHLGDSICRRPSRPSPCPGYPPGVQLDRVANGHHNWGGHSSGYKRQGEPVHETEPKVPRQTEYGESCALWNMFSDISIESYPCSSFERESLFWINKLQEGIHKTVWEETNIFIF